MDRHDRFSTPVVNGLQISRFDPFGLETIRSDRATITISLQSEDCGNLGSAATGDLESRQRVPRSQLRYQSPAVERAKPFFLVCPEFRRLDSMKMLTLLAGMGSANKYP